MPYSRKSLETEAELQGQRCSPTQCPCSTASLGLAGSTLGGGWKRIRFARGPWVCAPPLMSGEMTFNVTVNLILPSTFSHISEDK